MQRVGPRGALLASCDLGLTQGRKIWDLEVWN